MRSRRDEADGGFGALRSAVHRVRREPDAWVEAGEALDALASRSTPDALESAVQYCLDHLDARAERVAPASWLHALDDAARATHEADAPDPAPGPRWALVTHIRADEAGCSAITARALTMSPWLRQLRSFTTPLIHGHSIPRVKNLGAHYLLSAPSTELLEELVLPVQHIHQRPLRSLLDAAPRERLHTLCLRSNAIQDEGAHILWRADVLPALEHLDLHNCALTDEALRSLARAPRRTQLRTLYLGNNRFSLGAIGALLASGLPRLERIGFAHARIATSNYEAQRAQRGALARLLASALDPAQLIEVDFSETWLDFEQLGDLTSDRWRHALTIRELGWAAEAGSLAPRQVFGTPRPLATAHLP